MNNKLDSFNEDKVKCKKCKDYFNTVFSRPKLLCENCFVEWQKFMATPKDKTHQDICLFWNEFLKNNEQT